jgi:hypothetical protein
LTLPALCSKLSAQFKDDCKQDIPMANLETLLFEKNDGVAKITLNRVVYQNINDLIKQLRDSNNLASRPNVVDVRNQNLNPSR